MSASIKPALDALGMGIEDFAGHPIAKMIVDSNPRGLGSAGLTVVNPSGLHFQSVATPRSPSQGLNV